MRPRVRSMLDRPPNPFQILVIDNGTVIDAPAGINPAPVVNKTGNLLPMGMLSPAGVGTILLQVDDGQTGYVLPLDAAKTTSYMVQTWLDVPPPLQYLSGWVNCYRVDNPPSGAGDAVPATYINSNGEPVHTPPKS